MEPHIGLHAGCGDCVRFSFSPSASVPPPPSTLLTCALSLKKEKEFLKTQKELKKREEEKVGDFRGIERPSLDPFN